MTNITRKLATICTISEINPIPDADQIEVATIKGWKVVVRKGEYQIGQQVIYCEIDSFIPHEVATFLTKPDRFPSEYQGIKGERLRTVKLRGQVSQGLILPLPESMQEYEVGQDVTEELGIVKWEPPIDASLAGQVKGNFPSFLIKTNQERVQNLKREMAEAFYRNERFEITEKLDGSSATFFCKDGEFGVCSRNLELKEDESNTFWKVARKYDLETYLKAFSKKIKNIAVQAELVGPKIQGNPYKLEEHIIRVFDIFDIDNYTYVPAPERYEYVRLLGLTNVPVLEENLSITTPFIDGDFGILKMAEGKSRLNPETEREGIVYKSLSNPNFSFKVISNKFLLKQK
jgi:RNA ligase (TIGR02306 family)